MLNSLGDRNHRSLCLAFQQNKDYFFPPFKTLEYKFTVHAKVSTLNVWILCVCSGGGGGTFLLARLILPDRHYLFI